jgi:L-fuconolactonase
VTVDAHCHVALNWYEPVEVLLEQMDRAEVEQAVLVQLLGCYDNDYLIDCVQRYPGRFAAVVAVDAARDDAPQLLARSKAEGAAGVRFRPTMRSPGEDPLALWRCAAAQGLPVSCVGNPETFASPLLLEVLETLPELPVMLEHLGGTSAADTSDALRAARAATWSLSRFRQVFLKVPGLGEFEPRIASLEPGRIPMDLAAATQVLEGALKAFGADRLLWGSDFPVVASREGYHNALQWSRRLLTEIDRLAIQQIFGATARTLFRGLRS